MTVTVRDAVFDLMGRFGMTRVSGNPGSTELQMFRGFPSQVSYVLGLQEAVVVGMADGYAQATRSAAVVNLHSAVGVGKRPRRLQRLHQRVLINGEPRGETGKACDG